jgi:hypothetical protein
MPFFGPAIAGQGGLDVPGASPWGGLERQVPSVAVFPGDALVFADVVHRFSQMLFILGRLRCLESRGWRSKGATSRRHPLENQRLGSPCATDPGKPLTHHGDTSTSHR